MVLLRSIVTIGGLTMVSRVLGFIRDMLIAAVLGAGPVADAFFVAFRLPNLFRALFAEGAFSAAFVPLFAKRVEAEGEAQAVAFAEQAFSVLLTALLVFLIAFELTMPVLIYVSRRASPTRRSRWRSRSSSPGSTSPTSVHLLVSLMAGI